jgi:hypothetical protein
VPGRAGEGLHPLAEPGAVVGDRHAYRMGGVGVLGRGVDEFTATEFCGGHPLADQVQDREHRRLRG